MMKSEAETQKQQAVTIYSDRNTPQPFSPTQIVNNIDEIQSLLKNAMVPGRDFGQIPGCPRPTLFKSGAEIIMMSFKLGAFMDIERDPGDDPIVITVKTRVVFLPTGFELGMGVGMASSDEEKYRWREAVCEEEYNVTPSDQRRIKYKRKKGGGNFTVQQVRTSPPDIANTILKMAAKRSRLDAVLTTTAASGLFLQDIIDEETGDPISMDVPMGATKKADHRAPRRSENRAAEQKQSEAKVAKFVKCRARYTSNCALCGNSIEKGSIILYASGTGSGKGSYHQECGQTVTLL